MATAGESPGRIGAVLLWICSSASYFGAFGSAGKPDTDQICEIYGYLLSSVFRFSSYPGMKKDGSIPGTARLNDWNRSPDSR